MNDKRRVETSEYEGNTREIREDLTCPPFDSFRKDKDDEQTERTETIDTTLYVSRIGTICSRGITYYTVVFDLI